MSSGNTGRRRGLFRDGKFLSEGFDVGNIELIGGVGWTYIGVAAVALAGWWKNR